MFEMVLKRCLPVKNPAKLYFTALNRTLREDEFILRSLFIFFSGINYHLRRSITARTGIPRTLDRDQFFQNVKPEGRTQRDSKRRDEPAQQSPQPDKRVDRKVALVPTQAEDIGGFRKLLAIDKVFYFGLNFLHGERVMRCGGGRQYFSARIFSF